MIDALILMTLAALAWIGWLIGMLRPRAQFWVKFVGPIGLAWLTWYFFVALSQSKPELLAGGLEAGRITVCFMIGGVWALLARPKPLPGDRVQDTHHHDGATPA